MRRLRDITYCVEKNCPVKDKCERFWDTSNSMDTGNEMFWSFMNPEFGPNGCDSFWEKEKISRSKEMTTYEVQVYTTKGRIEYIEVKAETPMEASKIVMFNNPLVKRVAKVSEK